MCGRFIPLPRTVVEDIVKEIDAGRYVNIMPDWPARVPNAYPGSTVPIVIPADTRLTVEDMVWGYEVAWRSDVVFNTRFETASSGKTNMWSESLTERRCLIPTAGFFEPHRTETRTSPKTGKEIKRQYLFEMPDSSPLFIGGIYEEDRFSIVTTKANEHISPIHERMPLVLNQREISQWLRGEYAELENRQQVELKNVPLDGNLVT